MLSPSTAKVDRVTKRDYFMRNNVAVYWIVDVDGMLFEEWRPGQDRPSIVTGQLEWNPSGASEPFRLQLPEFFRDVETA